MYGQISFLLSSVEDQTVQIAQIQSMLGDSDELD